MIIHYLFKKFFGVIIPFKLDTLNKSLRIGDGSDRTSNLNLHLHQASCAVCCSSRPSGSPPGLSQSLDLRCDA